MEQREGNSKHWVALTSKARNLVVDTSCGVLGAGGLEERQEPAQAACRAVRERAQSEGRDDRNLGREGKSGKLLGYRTLVTLTWPTS